MRFRITIRGDEVELRGRIDGDIADVQQMARNAEPWVVVASPAADDYDPFDPSIDLHSLAYENARLRAQLASPPPGWYAFGTHAHTETPMEFFGQVDGLPVWERPKVEEAQAEAERRWPIYPHGVTDTRSIPDIERNRAAFVMGANWARGS